MNVITSNSLKQALKRRSINKMITFEDGRIAFILSTYKEHVRKKDNIFVVYPNGNFSTLKGHGTSINDIILLKDERLLSLSEDNIIKIWSSDNTLFGTINIDKLISKVIQIGSDKLICYYAHNMYICNFKSEILHHFKSNYSIQWIMPIDDNHLILHYYRTIILINVNDSFRIVMERKVEDLYEPILLYDGRIACHDKSQHIIIFSPYPLGEVIKIKHKLNNTDKLIQLHDSRLLSYHDTNITIFSLQTYEIDFVISPSQIISLASQLNDGRLLVLATNYIIYTINGEKQFTFGDSKDIKTITQLRNGRVIILSEKKMQILQLVYGIYKAPLKCYDIFMKFI